MADGIKISELAQFPGKQFTDVFPFSGADPFGSYSWNVQTFLNLGQTGLTGGGTSNLDGRPTAKEAPLQIWNVTADNLLSPYQLQASTAAQSLPNVVHPLDFDSGNNPKVFQLLGFKGQQIVLTGVAGAGYAELNNQSGAPGTPSAAARLYADASNRPSWIQPDGFTRTWSGAPTASRVYTLPDASGTVALTNTNCVPSIAGTSGQVLVNGGTVAVTGAAATLSLATGLTSVNSVTSAAGQALILATGTNGTALSIASATGTITLSAGLVGTSATFSALTSGRVPFASTAGLLTDDSDMTFSVDTLTVTKVIGGGISLIANAATNLNSVTSAASTALALNGNGNVTINTTNGSTLAATFSGANTTLAGNLTVSGNAYVGISPSTLRSFNVGTSSGDAWVSYTTGTLQTLAGLSAGSTYSWRIFDATNAVFLWSLSAGTGNGALLGNLTVSGTGTHTFGTTNTLAINGGQMVAVATGSLYQSTGATTSNKYLDIRNTSGGFFLGVESSTGSTMFSGGTAYSTNFGTQGAFPLLFATNGIVRHTISSAGDETLTGNLTVSGTGTSSFAGNLSVSGTARIFDVATFGPGSGYVVVSYDTNKGLVYAGSGSSLNLGANNSAAHLVISTAGDTTLAGNLTVSGASFNLGTGAASLGTVTQVINAEDAAGKMGLLIWASNSSYKWMAKAASNTDGNLWSIGQATGATTLTPVLSLNYGTSLATFAGNLTVSGTGTSSFASDVSLSGTKSLTVGGDVFVKGSNAANSGQITSNSGAGGLYFANVGTSTNMRFLTTDGAGASVQALLLAATSGSATFGSTTSGTSTTAAAILGKSMGLTENLFVGGDANVIGVGNKYSIVTTTATSNDAAFKSTDGTNSWFTGILGTQATDGAYRWFGASAVRMLLSAAGALTVNGTVKAVLASGGKAATFDSSENVNGVYTQWTRNGSTASGFVGTNNQLIGGGLISDFGVGSATGNTILSAAGTAGITISSSGGNVTLNGNLTTAAPTSGTAAPWKLGSYVAAEPSGPVGYVQVDLSGVAYQLPTGATSGVTYGSAVAQTAAAASVATVTVGAADASYIVSSNVLVTTSTTYNFTVTCAYTDEGNTSRTLTLSFSNLSGTFLTAITNVTGAGPYEGVPSHIRCKAGTSITIATTGTFTSVTYNARGAIEQIN